MINGKKLSFLLFMLLPNQALSQSVGLVPPVFSVETPDGFDVLNRTYSYHVNDLTIGSELNGSMIKFDRRLMMNIYNSVEAGWAYGIFTFLNNPINYNNSLSPPTVVYDGNSVPFLLGSNGIYVDPLQNGNTLTYVSASGTGNAISPDANGIYVYTARDGTVIDFPVANGEGNSADYLASKVIKPNGISINYTYQSVAINGFTYHPITRVVNSFGFGFRFNTSSSSNIIGEINEVDAIAAPCVASDCGDVVKSSVSFTYSSSYAGSIASASYSDGRQMDYNFTYGSGSSDNIMHIWNPGLNNGDIYINAHIDDSYTYQNPLGTQQWTLSGDSRYLASSSTTATTYVQDALGNKTTYLLSGGSNSPSGVSVTYIFGHVSQITDPLQRVTSATYDNYNRVLNYTYPEGNMTSLTYDGRGNILTRTQVPKSGSGLSNIVESQTFPACTSANQNICNNPSSSVDGNGNETDYVWDSTSGKLLTKTSPPDASGNRPTTNYQLTSVTGVDTANIWLYQTKTDKISSSTSLVHGYYYDSGNHYLLKGESDSSQGAYYTCYSNDGFGNRISMTKANSGSTSC